MIEIIIPRIVPTLNRLLRMHWSARRSIQREWNDALWVERLQRQKLAIWPLSKAWVHVYRQGPKKLDIDNLHGAAKIVVDALKHAQIIQDDSPDHIELVVSQALGSPQTIIRLEPLEALKIPLHPQHQPGVTL